MYNDLFRFNNVTVHLLLSEEEGQNIDDIFKNVLQETSEFCYF